MAGMFTRPVSGSLQNMRFIRPLCCPGSNCRWRNCCRPPIRGNRNRNRQMPHRLITEQERFEELCEHVRHAGEVAFDTEFLSEHTYRPELCLLQFATRERSAA